MKKIQQIVGEKLVSHLMAPVGQKSEQESSSTMETLVEEADNMTLQSCFGNAQEYLTRKDKTYQSWKELYAGMVEGWMEFCQLAVLKPSSEKMDSQYVASRVAAASLLLQIGKEDASYAQLCDAWAHRSRSQPPGRKQFRETMTNWINANKDEVMSEVRRLQEEFVVR